MSKLIEELSSTVWVLRTEGHNDGKIFMCTGFSVDKSGLIMTCSHRMNQEEHPNLRFLGRKLGDTDFKYMGRVVLQLPKWDLTLIQIENVGDEEFNFCKFSGGNIDVGESLVLIGHPNTLVGSVLMGHAAYRCVDTVNLPTATADITCKDFKSTAMQDTPMYRVLGHMVNSYLLDNDKVYHIPDETIKCHPLIPVIEIRRMNTAPGASGAPVFNLKGEIVGMNICGSSIFNVAFHVTILKEAIRLYHVNLKREAPVGDEPRDDRPAKFLKT